MPSHVDLLISKAVCSHQGRGYLIVAGIAAALARVDRSAMRPVSNALGDHRRGWGDPGQEGAARAGRSMLTISAIALVHSICWRTGGRESTTQAS